LQLRTPFTPFGKFVARLCTTGVLWATRIPPFLHSFYTAGSLLSVIISVSPLIFFSSLSI
jgi:hypothetical protein